MSVKGGKRRASVNFAVSRVAKTEKKILKFGLDYQKKLQNKKFWCFVNFCQKSESQNRNPIYMKILSPLLHLQIVIVTRSELWVKNGLFSFSSSVYETGWLLFYRESMWMRATVALHWPGYSQEFYPDFRKLDFLQQKPLYWRLVVLSKFFSS